MGLLEVTQQPSLFQGGSINPGNYSAQAVSNPALSANPIGPRLPGGGFYSGGQPLPSQGQVLGAGVNVAPTGAARGGGGGVNTSASLQAIEDAYKQVDQTLIRQTGLTNDQYAQAGTNLQNNYTQSQGDINANLTKTTGDITSAQGQVGQTATNATADARQAYNELQQRQNAQLSASGLGSSSVNEAMTESLGRQTFQALNNITQNKQQTLNNLQTQQKQVNDFYQRQQTTLTQGFESQKASLGLQLRDAIGRIQDAQSLNVSQKSQATAQVVQAAQQAASNLSSQLAAQQANIDSWNNVKQQVFGAVQGYAGGQISLQAFNDAIAKTNATLSNQGIQLNTPAILNATVNPTAAGTATNWFVEFQPNVVSTGTNPTTGATSYGILDPTKLKTIQ